MWPCAEVCSVWKFDDEPFIMGCCTHVHGTHKVFRVENYYSNEFLSIFQVARSFITSTTKILFIQSCRQFNKIHQTPPTKFTALCVVLFHHASNCVWILTSNTSKYSEYLHVKYGKLFNTFWNLFTYIEFNVNFGWHDTAFFIWKTIHHLILLSFSSSMYGGNAARCEYHPHMLRYFNLAYQRRL